MILDLTLGQLIAGDSAIHLTPAERTLIEGLTLRRGRAGHETLALILWPADNQDDPVAALRVLVSKLRRKIAAAGWPKLIGTAYGTGYVLATAIEVRRAAPPPVIIPHGLRSTLESLLVSHPDTAAADRLLAVMAED